MSAPFDPDEPQFSIEEVAAAAKVSVPLIRKWLANNLLKLRKADHPGASGRTNFTRFTWRTTLRIATAVEIGRWGIPAKIALETAYRFTDSGGPPPPPHLPTVETDDERRARIIVGPMTRNPGELFRIGETLLVFSNRTAPGILENVRADRPFQSPRQHHEATLLIIDCAGIVDRTASLLAAGLE